MKLQLAAHMKSYRDLVDGSANLTFSTEELSDEDILLLRRFRNETGWLLFSPNPIQEKDIPHEAAETDRKTQSSRIRSHLFVLWKELGEPDTFQIFYDKETERYINWLKKRLDS